MTTIVIFVIAGLIFAWDWYRLYQHNIKKGTRPLIAHMLGFMLGIFPAQFFIYASFASFPPPEIAPPSTLAIVSLWAIFVISIIALVYITSRPIVLGPREEPPVREPKR